MMKEVKKIIIEYEANDGSMHRTKEQCERYERRQEFVSQTITLPNRKVYISMPLGTRLSGSICVFSTWDKANKDALSDKRGKRQPAYTVEEFLVDDYLWEETFAERNM